MSHICTELHKLVSKQTRFRYPYDPKQVPENGIYILFENGELGHGGQRIVQIGSHSKDDRLRSRLNDHFQKENKDLSILRKHIGRCILHRANDPYLEAWELDSTTVVGKANSGHRVKLEYQQTIEQQVTEYIQKNFTFSVLELDYAEDRTFLKARIASTVAACKECNPSATWLGRSSPLEKIHYSGLWQVNDLNKEPLTSDDLTRMAELLP